MVAYARIMQFTPDAPLNSQVLPTISGIESEISALGSRSAMTLPSPYPGSQQKVRDLRHVDDADDIVPQVVARAAASTPLPAEQPKPSLLLNDAIKEYLAEVKIHESAKTFAAYRKTLYHFSPDAAKEAGKSPAKITRQFANKPLCEVSRKDLLCYAQFLKAEQGSVPRTVRNRIDFFQIFLHHYGLPSLLKGKDLPQYTEKKARAYNPGQLTKLFAEATQDETDLLHFFLCAGAREQEAKFVFWTDVDLQLKTYTITEHLDLG
jgi:integrase/recombinase XerD